MWVYNTHIFLTCSRPRVRWRLAQNILEHESLIKKFFVFASTNTPPMVYGSHSVSCYFLISVFFSFGSFPTAITLSHFDAALLFSYQFFLSFCSSFSIHVLLFCIILMPFNVSFVYFKLRRSQCGCSEWRTAMGKEEKRTESKTYAWQIPVFFCLFSAFSFLIQCSH